MSKKRILYMSCHEILEYDEVKLFSELGHEVYSMGAYTHPGGQENRKRPPLDLPYDPHFIEMELQHPKEALIAEQLEGIDIVIIMHRTDYVVNNWNLFRQFIKNGGRVIWRTIGQSIQAREDEVRKARDQGLEIVRYSPTESTIPGYVGSDAMIRFYKDPDEYKGWTGEDNRVINFTQSLKSRAAFCGFDTYMEATRGLDRVVYGPNNEDLGRIAGGMLSNDEQLEAYRKGRVYFYHGTYPASYTLTLIEAMMTGIPVVAVGPLLGNGPMFNGQQTYEVPDIIENGVSGFVADTPGELRECLELMLKDKNRAKMISVYGRNRAIELFGKAKIKSEWAEYLDRS
jgi:glycosyltransferase involved in cell wall biosynthesis